MRRRVLLLVALITTHCTCQINAPASRSLASCPTLHEGDASKPGCFGWCSPIFRAEHCGWCACMGCGWCGGATGAGASALPGSSVAGGGSAVDACHSGHDGDSTFRDCASFCSSQYKADHCGLCKCKACGFCACESQVEGDSADELCEPWCALEFRDTHCDQCKCKACPMCRAAPALMASTTRAAPEQCTPADADDVSVLDCQTFCSPTYKHTHCARCQCQQCEWCSCSSTHAGDAKHATCAPWCDVGFHRTHCDWCACQGCEWCREGVPCDSFLPDDGRVETCDVFCDAYFADSHCEMCKCKSCEFCDAEGMAGVGAGSQKTTGAQGAATRPTALPSASTSSSSRSKTTIVAAAAPPPPPSCSSGILGDTTEARCESFCNVLGGEAHCKMCKCQLCSFCTGKCSSGLLGDSQFASCEPGCEPTHAADHCRYCRCQGCKLCDASPPPPYPPGLAPAPVAARVVAARGEACVSLALGDLPFESCEQPTCGAAPGPEACTTCRCKGCIACGGSMGSDLAAMMVPPPPLPVGAVACSSRWKEDVGTSECQVFCDPLQKDIHCTLCDGNDCVELTRASLSSFEQAKIPHPR